MPPVYVEMSNFYAVSFYMSFYQSDRDVCLGNKMAMARCDPARIFVGNEL